MEIASIHVPRRVPYDARRGVPVTVRIRVRHSSFTTVDEKLHLSSRPRPDIVVTTIIVAYHVAVFVAVSQELRATRALVLPDTHVEPMFPVGLRFVLHENVVLLS